MSIENFKKANLVLDSADSYILETQFSKVGDISGRDLVVQITNKGVVENQPFGLEIQTAQNGDSALRRINIMSNGNVTIGAANFTTSWLSLANISFRAEN